VFIGFSHCFARRICRPLRTEGKPENNSTSKQIARGVSADDEIVVSPRVVMVVVGFACLSGPNTTTTRPRAKSVFFTMLPGGGSKRVVIEGNE